MLVHLQLTPTQKTCLFTNGNKANVSDNLTKDCTQCSLFDKQGLYIRSHGALKYYY